MNSVLITGAAGLLGSHLLEQSPVGPDRLVLACRGLSKRSYLATRPDLLERVVRADLSDAAAPAALLQGVTTVINAMGNAVASDAASQRRDNFEATRRLFEEATRSGVRQWIQVSSIGALNDSPSNGYLQQKADCDAWLREQASPNLKVSFVYPSFMLGPWDSRPASAGILLALKMRRLRHLVDAPKCFVSPRSVAQAIWTLVESSEARDIVMAGIEARISDFARAAAPLLGLAQDDLKFVSAAEAEALPETERTLLRAFCYAVEAGPHASARPAPELSLEEMIAETIAYLKAQRMML